jgi:hypothetical protein
MNPMISVDIDTDADDASRDHSGWMPAARMTLPHFSVSSSTSLANSAGVIGIGMFPSCANRSLILGLASPALISLLKIKNPRAPDLIETWYAYISEPAEAIPNISRLTGNASGIVSTSIT